MVTRADRKKHLLSVYGNVTLERAQCPASGCMAIVLRGKTVSCEEPVSGIPEKYHRETIACYERKRPPMAEQSRILDEQENPCICYSVEFGILHERNGNPFMISICWDHKLPFALSQNNHTSNFVAGCQVCKGDKSDHLLRDLEEAKEYLAGKRKQNG
jgi:hypothetical protein